MHVVMVSLFCVMLGCELVILEDDEFAKIEKPFNIMGFKKVRNRDSRRFCTEPYSGLDSNIYDGDYKSVETRTNVAVQIRFRVVFASDRLRILTRMNGKISPIFRTISSKWLIQSY